MSIKLSDSIRVGQQKPLEDKYFNELVPYTSTTQVNTLLLKSIRHIGLTVNINGEEYWYKDGIEDSNLVPKIPNYDLKNQEQDSRLENLEGENANQNDLINDLFSELQSEKTRNDIQDNALNNLEGIYYVWSPTNRTLTLYDREGTQLSQVSLVSLDNEGTDLRYNASTLSLELYNKDNELLDSIPVSSFIGSVGTQLQLNSNQLQLKDSQGNILSTVTFEVSDINGLQTALDTKFDKEKFSSLLPNYIPFLHSSSYFFNSPFYVDTTNYYYVGLNNTNPTEYLDVNGNIKAIGFKTPTGTPNKALTANGGVFDLNTKADLIGGKIPASQLPAYVDDVLEFANLASFPVTGENGKIYIAIDTNLTYRWGGSSYVVMSSSLALGETSSTAYRGDRGKIAYDHSQVTHDKNLVGLGNVDNTSDLNKPISIATQTALDLKLDKGTYTGTASDLVPYTGATQDVNIASNYFKTSKGFNFTYDESNYFKTDHSNSYNNLIFYSEDSSNDNFGYMFIEASPEIGFVVNIANGDGIYNSFHATESRTYSEKPFVSSEGFIKTGGTANQALTANGGVYDLTTKADLIGGKVPKAQSQPSTMVMNSSTYVITFTDATGAVQTIDLPLESLFKDANYDAQTKSLIVTLDNGTTKSIPLTDLVDLPEIVLSNTNPSVNPTTGQKVYFNTSLGKVWFNVSGAWVFAGNLISDSEKANITTAYTHSQTTGNPHNTKVEELTDVSGDANSIVDTDVILKKETGGFWRKITFANFKNWFTTELAKKINKGTDTVFNFKNISAMALSDFRSITPDIETIYFTEEQNATGWQQVRYNSNFFQGCSELVEKTIIINGNPRTDSGKQVLELDSDSSFNLIDVENTKIHGVFENDFVIITFSGQVWTQNTATANQWVKLILKINGVQAAVAPVFYLTEPAGTPERISHSFALNVTAEMVTHGATLHLKPSAYVTLYRPSITVARVHKSTNANL